MRTSHLFTLKYGPGLFGENTSTVTQESTQSVAHFNRQRVKGERASVFFSPSHEVLFVQGGCRAPSRTDGWIEGGSGGGREGGGEDEWLLHSKSMHKQRVSEGASGRKGGGGHWGCKRSFVKAGS